MSKATAIDQPYFLGWPWKFYNSVRGRTSHLRKVVSPNCSKINKNKKDEMIEHVINMAKQKRTNFHEPRLFEMLSLDPDISGRVER